jgi:predicted Zn-dependent protease
MGSRRALLAGLALAVVVLLPQPIAYSQGSSAPAASSAPAKPAAKPKSSGRGPIFMSRASERRLGAQEHPKLLAEFGGPYKDDNVSGYVAQIGGRTVVNSEMASEAFTFTLLNSSIINAFALPGGYVYISRQLMALMNDEAELASVLGHEVGHVTDRHTAKRYDRSILTNILAVGVGIATGSGQMAQLAGQVGQAWTLSYSRNQEFSADRLGIGYIANAGYDPFAAAAMLTSLGAQTSLDARMMGRDAEQVPTWARTHPLTADRVTRATQLAAQTGIAPNTRARNQDAFLAKLDGMVYDDDPEQGFVRGRTFSHPKLMLTFTAPQGYFVQNGSDAVVMRGPNGAAALFSTGPVQAGEALQAHIQRAWAQLAGQQAPYPLGQARATTINGLDAAIAAGRVQDSRGNQLDVAIVAYRWSPTQAYHFTILTPAAVTAQVDAGLQGMVNSFRRMTKEQADALVERRVRVVTVKAGDSMQSLAQRMAYDDNALERFQVLNALPANATLRPGQKVKIIVFARS